MTPLNGLPPEFMLAALYNGTQPLGMGFLAAVSAPARMTPEMAKPLLADLSKKPVMFDYLGGRPLKVHFVDDGQGAAACGLPVDWHYAGGRAVVLALVKNDDELERVARPSRLRHGTCGPLTRGLKPS